MGATGGYVCLYRACGDGCVATKRKLVEILKFRHFLGDFVFGVDSENIRNKQQKSYFDVSVVVDIECGDTNVEQGFLALTYPQSVHPNPKQHTTPNIKPKKYKQIICYIKRIIRNSDMLIFYPFYTFENFVLFLL